MAEVLEKIRPVMVDLIGLDGERVAKLTIIVAVAELPKIVMFNGDPYLIEENPRIEQLLYFQERPFRADLGF